MMMMKKKKREMMKMIMMMKKIKKMMKMKKKNNNQHKQKHNKNKHLNYMFLNSKNQQQKIKNRRKQISMHNMKILKTLKMQIIKMFFLIKMCEKIKYANIVNNFYLVKINYFHYLIKKYMNKSI